MFALPIHTILLIVAAAFTVPAIAIRRDCPGVQVTFTGELQSANTVVGPWTDMAEAKNPLTVTTNQPEQFFRAVERNNQMRIKVGTNTFIATLDDNATTKAFKAMLPMTVRMSDLNANEKFFRLSASLPTNEANPKTIQIGDLMLYGSNTLVLFYKTFPTPYPYTRLGGVTDTNGLAAALGSESVTVAFEME